MSNRQRPLTGGPRRRSTVEDGQPGDGGGIERPGGRQALIALIGGDRKLQVAAGGSVRLALVVAEPAEDLLGGGLGKAAGRGLLRRRRAMWLERGRFARQGRDLSGRQLRRQLQRRGARLGVASLGGDREPPVR